MMPIRSHLLVGGGTAANSAPMIGYDNIFNQTGVITATGTNYANALDWLTYDGWVTTATGAVLAIDCPVGYSCDYFAFAGHDLYLYAGVISLEYWTGAAWVELASAAPGDASPIMLTFNVVASDQYRVVVTCTTACTVGVVAAGRRLQFPHGHYVGFSPPGPNQSTTLYNSRAQSGQFLGRSVVRTGYSASLELEHMTPQWTRDNAVPFSEHARTRGWFLLWNPARYPNEAAYCWTTTDVQMRNAHSSFMAVTIKFEARI